MGRSHPLDHNAEVQPTKYAILSNDLCDICVTFLKLACTSQRISSLAPSARVTAYLASRGKLPTMALTAYTPPKIEQDILPPPPPVVITPCDPWPRPYFLQDGLRRVAPYHFTYNTWCKQRWRGREILGIFKDEFRDRSVEYYVCSGQKR